MKRVAVLSLLCLAAAVIAMPGQVSPLSFKWFAAGAGLVLPRELIFENASGRLGILDYYKMRNIQADTDMRRAIAGPANAAPVVRSGEALLLRNDRIDAVWPPQ